MDVEGDSPGSGQLSIVDDIAQRVALSTHPVLSLHGRYTVRTK